MMLSQVLPGADLARVTLRVEEPTEVNLIEVSLCTANHRRHIFIGQVVEMGT